MIFDKARKIISKENTMKNSNLISLVYFDELGLAEISNNNPLKVLHNELEFDEHENKIAFVGVSNWALDASKMNRGIFLSIVEPDENDLIKTANTIANSYDDRLTIKFKSIFEKLARSYKQYLIVIKEKYTDYKNFHGLRDFYYLIKQTAKSILKEYEKLNENSAENKAISCIERNFGGFNFSAYEFKKIFTAKLIDKNYEIIPHIINNIQEIDENEQISIRYLMIITKSSISQYLIDYILREKLNKNYIFRLGSNFEDDLNKDYYNVKMINRYCCIKKFRNYISIFL